MGLIDRINNLGSTVKRGLTALFLIGTMQFGAGCDHGEEDLGRPVADAGTDQVADEGNPVLLNGSASYDPDGTVASHSWTQVSGPTATLDDPTSPTPSFTAPRVDDTGAGPTDVSFALTVTDNQGKTSDPSYVFVAVNDTSQIVAYQVGDKAILFNPDGTGGTPIGTVTGIRPRFLPTDSQTITFDGFGDLRRVRTDGSLEQNLTNSGAVTEEHCAVNPNGTKIAYRRDGQLYIADFNGSSISNESLLDSDSDCRHPVFSKDGQWVYFGRKNGTYFDVHRIKTDGSSLENLTPSTPSSHESSPDVSEGRLAYGSDESGRYQIIVADLDGSNPQQVTNTLQNAEHPNFSDTGNMLVYLDYNGSMTVLDLRTIRIDGTGDKMLSEGSFNYAYPDWQD